jgi:predicted helicase
MNLPTYVETIAKRYKSGISSEHTYRADLEGLIRELVPGVEITNEPSKVTDCGNPDYVITKKKIPIGFIEAKDLGKNLNSKQYKEQFNRYKKALDNLIITDYLWFQFFQNGQLVHEIKIGEIDGNTVRPFTDHFNEFQDLIVNFCTFVGQTIKSSKKLAEMMAAKARLLETILEKAVSSDEITQDNSSLKQQYESFKEVLIHDLTPKAFADIYAQTLAYGMFAARLHDTSLEDFSRQEAAELIPKTNPFLRKLFQYVAGYDIDERIRTTVDNLAEVFRATDVNALLKNLGKSIYNNDPIIHFYETFLAEYDPKLRRARGVWYTPEPVVKFIVRAVDDLLKSEFCFKDGLADTSKTTIKVKAQGTAISKGRNKGKAVYFDKEVHKIQVLDPATGTGTFLAEVVKFIYNKKFKAMQGVWSSYVEDHLIPRLNGFELLMASYSMAHLKLDMLLSETGYKPKKEQRFNIYLTNSLEEHHPYTGTLFTSWLSSEANEANHIKRDTPVMVVIGNPPYSGESANKGEWIMKLMEDYKKEPGGNEKLKERNPKWINDDYVKFLRYGQYFIERNGEGILAFINPHGFLDNPTFRGMRWNLLKTYDKIYTLDLHGNSKKKETCLDGTSDVNVFDIQQGVSINFFIKTGKKKKDELGQVYHFDLLGERDAKYQFLLQNSIKTISYQELPNVAPMYYMVQKDFEKEKQYNAGFNVKEFFKKNSMGVTTGADSKLVSFSNNFSNEFAGDYTAIYSYRPFDNRFIYYNHKYLARARNDFMEELKNEGNLGLSMIRRDRGRIAVTPFCTKNITDKCISSSLDNANIFLLYRDPPANGQQTIGPRQARMPNINPIIIGNIAKTLGLIFTREKEEIENTVAPIDLFDYIYAVLHSPSYRENYKEFLKIDFPKVPYPKDKKTFWQLVKLGSEIRLIHLLESTNLESFITSYPEDGDNVITRKLNKKDWELYDTEKQLGRIWINETQYFDKIPLTAWEFYIGGYQPAQKWLKDRRDRTLSFEDILHYQKIIVALFETNRLMQEIDKIDFETDT